MQLSQTELKYAFCQLAQRAGFEEASPGNTTLQNVPVRIIYTPHQEIGDYNDQEDMIIICAAEDGAFDQLISAPEKSLDWVPREYLLPENFDTPISNSMPILFPVKNGVHTEAAIEKKGNIIIINFDIVSAAFFMLSRYEEYRLKLKDRYGRFPANQSIAFKQSFLKQPIVDEYAMILRAWIQYLAPSWHPQIRTGKILPTHDIDFIRTLPNLRKAARMIIKESQSYDPLYAVNAVWHRWKAERSDLSKSIYIQAIEKLCTLSQQNNMKSTFFFKTTPSGFFDSGYDIRHNALKPIFTRIQDMGFSIGLHPGFRTVQNDNKILREKNALEAAIGHHVSECRQHYLRFQVPQTWRKQIKAGLIVDNSLAFAEHVGFRCGTCHPYHPFDVMAQTQLEILERPLIVMDSTLKDYMQLSVDHAEKLIGDLAYRCLKIEGDFTLLWHNTSFFNQWEEWGTRYISILQTLSAL